MKKIYLLTLAARTRPRADYQLLLVCVVRSGSAVDREAYVEGDLVDGPSVFDGAKDILIRGGFKPEQIIARTIAGVASRAGYIIETAATEDCGAIVVGRRGLSRIAEFFIGRVSSKVVQASDAHTVWVVS